MQNFDAALNTPKVVEKRLVYMTPEWKAAFLFATKKAGSLGLELAIAGSPGWSETGGPWVESSQAMKKFVWSTHNPYKANSPLLPSGLLGAVQVIRVSSQQP
jgi:hypothetical protein